MDIGLTQPEKRVTSTSPIGVEVGADIAGAVAGAGVYLAHGSCRENVRKGLSVPNHAGVVTVHVSPGETKVELRFSVKGFALHTSPGAGHAGAANIT